MSKKTFIFNTDLSNLSDQIQKVEDTLSELQTKSEDKIKSLLLLEEVVVEMAHAAEGVAGATIKATLSKSYRKTSIKLSCKGKDAGIASILTAKDVSSLDPEFGDEAVEVIRGMLISSYSNRFSSRYTKGVNQVDITVSKNDKVLLIDTLMAIGLGLCAGLVARLGFSAETAGAICTYAFLPLYKAFLAAISMVVAPLVFFSIASSLGSFTDLSALGRTGGKVFLSYLGTTGIAISLAFLFNAIVRPGVPGIIPLPSASGEETEMITIPFIDTILSMVPNNFLGAFVSSDMIQVMLLAILVGIAAGRMSKHSGSVRNFIDAANDLFGVITKIVSGFLPYAIFGSIANMAVTLDLVALGTLAKWAITVVACICTMMICYNLLLIIFGRLNPLYFIKKYFPATATAFMTSSSNATMPTSMECCRELGISPKIYSFSIPLGANVNMDGAAIGFTLSTLFAAGLYGIEVTGATLVTFITTVVMISVASPGVPGAGTACLLMLFGIVGVPPEAYGLLIGVLPLIELFETAGNVTGDGVVTAIVAKSENALDIEKYMETKESR